MTTYHLLLYKSRCVSMLRFNFSLWTRLFVVFQRIDLPEQSRLIFDWNDFIETFLKTNCRLVQNLIENQSIFYRQQNVSDIVYILIADVEKINSLGNIDKWQCCASLERLDHMDKRKLMAITIQNIHFCKAVRCEKGNRITSIIKTNKV